MADPYTLKRLTDVEDSAPKFGYGELQEARFATGELRAEATGVTFHRLKPGKRQPFGHRHEQAEEVNVILSGAGRVKPPATRPPTDDAPPHAATDLLVLHPRSPRSIATSARASQRPDRNDVPPPRRPAR